MPFELKPKQELPPEQPVLPESEERSEVRVEQPVERAARPETLPEQPLVAAPVTPTAPTPPTAATTIDAIEAILSDDLAEMFARMDPATQEEFKKTGEVTAQEIQTLLQQVKVQVRKIIRLLTSWLKMIPGVSELFIEQEAKIKVDQLLALKRDHEGSEQ